MSNQNKSYCIYLRKSRSDLEYELNNEEETLKRHEKILLDLAQKQKLNVTKIYKEVVSGESISSRPVMQQLLSEVEQSMWEGVLVVEVERLARGDTMDQGLLAQTFKYSGTKIITPMKTYDPQNEYDEEFFEFGLFMSRREYKTINRRLQRGRLESVKEGKFVGNTPPFGYVRKKLEHDKGFTLEISTEQAEAVRLIYRLYTEERIGVSLIVKELEKLNIKTAKGGYWSTSTLRGILSNPTYVGKIRWNHRKQVKKVRDGKVVKERPRSNDVVIVNGLHEAIISEETFDKAQKLLSENPSVPVPTRYKVENPLAGIIKCGKCGRNMNRKKQKINHSLMCPAQQCDNVSSYLDVIEERLLSSLRDWLDEYRLNMNNEDADDSLEEGIISNSISSIVDEIKTLKTQLNSLHDLLEQGVYTTEKFLERSNILNEKISSLQKNKNELEEKLRKNNQKKNEEIVNKIENVLEVYHKLKTPKQKNDLLKDIIDNAVYIKDEGGRWKDSTDDFQLILHPKVLK